MRHLLVAICCFSAAASAAVGALLVFGSYTFSTIPAASASNTGGIVYDDTSGALRVSNGSAWSRLGATTEAVDVLPVPYAGTGTNTVIPKLTTYLGGAYTVTSSVVFSKIAFGVATAASSPNITILVYQAPGGDTGVAKLVASVVGFSTPTPGLYVAPIAQGTASLEPGRLFILFGSTSNDSTVYAYSASAVELLSLGVPAGLFRTNFNTNIVPPNAPDTFDPIGAGVSDTTTFSALVVRLQFP